MKESVAITKDAAAKKESSHTRSDNSILRLRNEPERQLGSLRKVIGNIRRNGGTPSVESISTELSSVHSAQRVPVLLALQRTHGNRYVQRVVSGIQAKLKVGQPRDIYEQEADRVADGVMRMPEQQVQRQPEEAELLRSEWIERQIAEAKSSGQPLENNTRQFMESAFDQDFSDVRIHTNSKAAESAKALGAEAYTMGKDISFGVNRYQPDSKEGTKLIAHELTHVVQQRSSRGSFQEKITIGQLGDVYEQEADKIARMMVDGDTVNVKNKGLTPSTSLAERVQRVIDSIAAASLGVAVFGLVASLVPYGSGGLQWRRNIGRAVHRWPAGQEPAQNEWVRDFSGVLIFFYCFSGLSDSAGVWGLRWNYNGADIDQAHVYKILSTSWSGGAIGSAVNITFEMQDASASYESGGKAAMICYISGSLDPVGSGDIDYEARVLIYADGTTRKLGGFNITRGDASDFTITPFGMGWKVQKD